MTNVRKIGPPDDVHALIAKAARKAAQDALSTHGDMTLVHKSALQKAAATADANVKWAAANNAVKSSPVPSKEQIAAETFTSGHNPVLAYKIAQRKIERANG